MKLPSAARAGDERRQLRDSASTRSQRRRNLKGEGYITPRCKQCSHSIDRY
ncbi:hypothetical protein [Candidatus Regiella endosymbiont of Tuberolachnus salignus]|uniref:hypothetical protein n=1 Tax=Candidatus Regiella endosymbiont of Tuberolachnus salignus TaxID=3077956 RepID=UPI0030D093A1